MEIILASLILLAIVGGAIGFAHFWTRESGKRNNPTESTLPNDGTYTVARYEVDGQSLPYPPMDTDWTEMDKLIWRTALLQFDTGIRTRIVRHDRTIDGVAKTCYYGLIMQNNTIGPYSFFQLWAYINGIEQGYRLAQREREETP